MRNFSYFFLLIGSMLWAQAKPAKPAGAPKTPPAAEERDDEQTRTPASTVAPDAPVLTIRGFCTQKAPSGECQTVVTRAQFEQMVDALQPGADPKTKRHLATAYPQFLVMAEEAEKRGLDKQPSFADRMRFARLQILSQELVRQIQEGASRLPEKDIADYYQKNSSSFEQAVVERIVIPNRRELKADAEGTGQAKDSEDAVTKEAEALRVRAAAGEDFAKLQKEAYEFAGVSGNTEPNPNMGKLRRRGLPIAHVSVFDLKPGEVSPLISDATGHYIYKIDSKEIQPLNAVEPEISNILRRERMQEMLKSIQQRVTTDVNDSYFRAEAKDDDD